MSVVAPISGAAAVIPVLFGIATGDRPSPVQIAGVVCAVIGVALASQEHQEGSSGISPQASGWRSSRRSASAATSRRCTPPGRSTSGGARSSSARRRWCSSRRRSRSAGRRCGWAGATCVVCLLVGVGDTLGNILFAASSRSGLISLTSVLASLFPIVTIALAAIVLRERIASAQRLGVVLTLAGVVLISAG